MQFVKIEATLNDYIYVDCLDQPRPDDPAALATALCPRRSGVGADGLILITPSTRALCRMEMYNADGTTAEVCGNGLRAVAWFAFSSGWSGGGRSFELESGAGVHGATIFASEAGGAQVEVVMGAPRWDPEQIPVETDEPGPPPALDLRFEGEVLRGYAVSLGNPHCVVVLEEALDAFPLARFGPLVERDPRFPAGANVEVIQIEGGRIRQRTWERGSGETWSCGSGACAAVAVAARLGRAPAVVAVELRGGTLEVESGARLLLRGPVREVFRGEC